MSEGTKSMGTDTPRQGRRRPAAKPTENSSAAAAAIVQTDEVKGVTAAKGRATPGRRQVELAEAEERRGLFGRLVDYIQGVRAELDKVAWPTREQVGRLFRIVMIVTIVAAIILGAISLAFNELFAVGLQNPIIFVLVGVIVVLTTVYIMRREDQSKT
jgi:preprotein translocase SecE subunit